MAIKRGVSEQTIACRRYASVKDFFAVGELLGKGHTGHVRVVEDLETGREYVLKTILNKVPCEVNRVAQIEVDGLRHVSGHPNILELLGQFEDSSGVHLLLDYCKEGDLCSYILSKEQLKLQEDETAAIIRQVAAALRFCHSQNLLHRDVKAENVVLHGKVSRSDGMLFPHVKLADFGSSVILPSFKDKAMGVAGTLLYTAPEVFRNEPYGSEADIWSLGVVLYVALSGILPFYGKTKEEMYRSLCTKELTFHERQWASVSDEAIDLILWMLTPDVDQRATAVDVLNHPWIVQHTGQHLYLEVDTFKDIIATASVVLHPHDGLKVEERTKEGKKIQNQQRRKPSLFSKSKKDLDRGHFVHLAAVLCPYSAKSSKVVS